MNPSPWRWRWLWLCGFALVVPASVLAQSRPLAPGLGSNGLPELVDTARARFEPGVNVAATGAYGLTESVGAAEGPHHRLGARLAVAVAPVDWLAFALRMDGRLDLHPDDGMGAHASAVGDPRLLARAGYALSEATELGLELGVWVPGEDAPSIAAAAITPQARLLFSHAWPEHGWTLLSALGYRFDNSAAAAPPLDRLRPGDRMSLGLSDFHTVLIAVGASRALGEKAALFAELSADVMPGAPDVLASPLRATVGGRYRLSRSFTGEATLRVGLAKRPGIQPTDPPMPIEPRALLTLGVRYGYVFNPPRAPAPPQKPVAPPEPETAVVTGQLLDDTQAPLTDARVTLRASDGTVRQVFTDARGRYRFEDVPVGEVELTAEAEGFETKQWTLRVGPRTSRVAPRAMAPRPPAGVIRGLTRSFESEPLQARIIVTDASRGQQVASTQADAAGHFELTVPPGRYQVTIQAPGHRTQRREVHVRDGSVAILNVDLREQ